MADRDGQIVAHVTLHSTSWTAVLDTAGTFLGVDHDHLGVVSRLLVDPDRRGVGIGKQLLAVATDRSRKIGLSPILDDVLSHTDAIALYERMGWTRVGQVTSLLRDELTFEELV